MAIQAGIGAHGLWSISRGLARGLDSRADYKQMMDRADAPRQNDVDGRGNLSERALGEFVLWFLKVCLDQVTFMTSLFDSDDTGPAPATTGRTERRAETRGRRAPPRNARARRNRPRRGRLPERTARRVMNDVIDAGLLGVGHAEGCAVAAGSSELSGDSVSSPVPAELSAAPTAAPHTSTTEQSSQRPSVGRKAQTPAAPDRCRRWARLGVQFLAVLVPLLPPRAASTQQPSGPAQDRSDHRDRWCVRRGMGRHLRISALLVFGVFGPVGLLAQQDAGRVLPANRSVRVLAFGDFGVGGPNQRKVADVLLRQQAADPFDFGITLGDNFYRCGVRSVHDPKWLTRWEQMYTPLGIPFYAALGNHDYGHPVMVCPFHRGSAEAEVAYSALSKSWDMPAKYYTFTAGAVRFVAIDTDGWSAGQLAWIRKTLADSAGEPGIRWRVVYGHHPIYTSSERESSKRIQTLRAQLLPVLVANQVDFYVCGHDHYLEHLHADGIDFLIAGGGGAHLRSSVNGSGPSMFVQSEFGFLDLTIDDHRFTARFLNTDLTLAETPPLTRTK